ncbi:MAG: KTSC domain-containing protein [Gammaproteobacteria bacterium]|jgi:hypothetical protein|nr:KTSC domain-containing protein [Gammaproteobacteria bacterium]MBT3490125.1 KTSC domain-containing protein [Gammaproteobacteria bacterium]MBT3717302.1 KTSC domain-containing protein [Gammaproteobacteria bacterium]MBT3844593.1 KTSC domain-containing protein [Gammaproteobacteria bacterium]MBT3891901.1 KTSC domain-containing protein [Gammaproteobacteria bacterium]
MISIRAITLFTFLSIATNIGHAIERTPIGASGIVSAGYIDKKRVLEVEFKSGKIVHFYKVPFSTYDRLIESISKGKFYKNNIKGRFKHKTVGMVKKKKGKGKKKKKKKKTKKRE